VKSLRNCGGLAARITFDSQTTHRRRGDDVDMTGIQGQIRLLVVDDEPHIVDLVATALRYQGFAVLEARGGLDAIRAVETYDPALIVLDVMLPDVDGFEIVRRLRASGRRTPVLYLTARDGIEDRVRGLNVGGDDYLVKPFSLSELVARVNAILRRTLPARGSRVLSYADLTLDEDLHEVRRGGRIVDLTPTEYELLRYLLANPRQALSKSQILDHVWDYDFDGQFGVVDTYVSYLRRKLDPLGPPLIRTIRGVGYALRGPEE
jgi:two-component system OmpR family response regulator